MKLKEIKPGMTIQCDETWQLEELTKAGVEGAGSKEYIQVPCYVYIREDMTVGWNRLASVKREPDAIPFSELVIQELTPEAVLKELYLMKQEGFNLNELFSFSVDKDVLDLMDIIQEHILEREAQERENMIIHAGDIVTCNGSNEKYVVLATGNETGSMAFLRRLDQTQQTRFTKEEYLTKTGKSIDLEQAFAKSNKEIPSTGLYFETQTNGIVLKQESEWHFPSIEDFAEEYYWQETRLPNSGAVVYNCHYNGEPLPILLPVYTLGDLARYFQLEKVHDQLYERDFG